MKIKKYSVLFDDSFSIFYEKTKKDPFFRYYNDSDPYLIHYNSRGFYHNTYGPALKFYDSSKNQYWVNGVKIK